MSERHLDAIDRQAETEGYCLRQQAEFSARVTNRVDDASPQEKFFRLFRPKKPERN